MADQTQITIIQAACIQASATLLANNELLQKQYLNPGDAPELYAEAVINLASSLFESWNNGGLPVGTM